MIWSDLRLECTLVILPAVIDVSVFAYRVHLVHKIQGWCLLILFDCGFDPFCSVF